ncbi:MAG: hypothetical protein LBK97_03335 [Prevotellaceae bacterium]|jgi:hypothetical protein|nr:hypothetical protein [Prevotellaceae bacterium]
MARTIPKKDNDFNEEQEIITAMTEKNLTQWSVDQEWYNSRVKPAKTEWVAAWAAYLNPVQRTQLITFVKNDKRKTYEKALRILVQMHKSNPRISDDARRAMGIMMRDTTRTLTKSPTSYPQFIIDTSIIRCLIIMFWNLGSKSKAKPRGVRGAEICWAILDKPPVSVDELTHSDFDTRSPFELFFDESERGKTVYFCLRWESSRGEKGPWSEIVMAVIP